MVPYGRSRRIAAWNETKRFWNVHQIWKHFAAPATGAVLGIARAIMSGEKVLLDSILTALVWAAAFYTVAWLGTYLINYVWLTPAALHREQESALAIAREEARRLREAAAQTAALVRSERAWLLLGRVDPATLSQTAGETEFRFTLVNRGRTVGRLADRCRWQFCIVPCDSGLAEVPRYDDEPAAVMGDRAEDPGYARILAPGDAVEMDFSYWGPLDDETFRAILERRKWLYFYASLRYFDFADTERELQFCYLYVPRAGDWPERWVLGGPPAYNRHT